jgi:hypothetical protein
LDKALRASDELEKALVMRIEHEYGKETLKAIGDLKGFFRDVEALERKEPPVWMDEAAQKRWKRRELDALVQKHRVENRVMKAIRTAGAIAAPLIWYFLARVYGENASQTVEEAQKAQVRQGLAQNAMPEQVNTVQSATQQPPQQNFVPQKQREIEILLHDQQPPFSKIAFDNLEQAPALERRLRAEMRQAIINGEGQDKIRQRIQRVMQNGAYNARRIAQTERTRIQSQARWDVMRNAAAQGILMEKLWIARMKNTRDSHADLNRRTAKVDEPFTTIWGNELMYPGDPNAPAREVINCHCVLRPVLGDKTLKGDRKNAIMNVGGGDLTNEIATEIDDLTPCLRRVSDGQIVETTLEKIHPKKSNFNEWEFDWTIPEKEGYSVFALYANGDKNVQGLLATRIEKGYVDLALVEASPENSPHNPHFPGKKKYEGVGGHLFAEACKQSVESGNDGYVAFTAKTSLINHYQNVLGATVIYGQRMQIDEEAASVLIKKYFGR